MSGRTQLRPHQEEAVEAGVHALLRRQLAAVTIVAACGTGKTLISKRIAERRAVAGAAASGSIVCAGCFLQCSGLRWLSF
ncbi:DEAD/DEAH box helicase family protein [Streptomyces sp. NPDC027717]|uniref:DEAD/DEAH box helicase family protein n=1 Tax=Streptomyces sp. NPDC027717 TaxID=3155765 RepID=UPI0033F16467